MREAKLTDAERAVYAAAFAVTSVTGQPARGADHAMISGYVAVLHLREDEPRLKSSIDWKLARAMRDEFKRNA